MYVYLKDIGDLPLQRHFSRGIEQTEVDAERRRVVMCDVAGKKDLIQHKGQVEQEKYQRIGRNANADLVPLIANGRQYSMVSRFDFRRDLPIG